MNLFGEEDGLNIAVTSDKRNATSGTFARSARLPLLQWFKYTAGFSAEWVQQVLQENGAAKNILDPFVGSGTVLIEAEKANRNAVGIEAHPLIFRVAQSKLAWRSDPDALRAHCERILRTAEKFSSSTLPSSSLVDKCFTPEANNQLAALLKAIDAVESGCENLDKLVWLAFVSIIREVSFVGTAQWQYVLPNKRKSKVLAPFEAFYLKTNIFIKDMLAMRQFQSHRPASVVNLDAREDIAVEQGWADLVITSPPYANNYDYADATRLELTVLGEIKGWSDLQHIIRPKLVRACTQHVATQYSQLNQTLQSEILDPIRDELQVVVDTLSEVRETKGGKKQYHLMLAYYFYDLAKVLVNLRKQVRPGGLMCFVVGDSAPYGVYAPVDEWLGRLAIGAGFRDFSFEKLRDRNTKWKHRKHTVPLKEGRLWITA